MTGWHCVRILGTSCCCTSLQTLGGLLTSLCSLIFGAPAAGCHHWCGQAVQGVNSVRGPRLPARSGVAGHAFMLADAPLLAVQRPDLYCFAAVQPAGGKRFAQRCAGPPGTFLKDLQLQSRPFLLHSVADGAELMVTTGCICHAVPSSPVAPHTALPSACWLHALVAGNGAFFHMSCGYISGSTRVQPPHRRLFAV